VRGLVAGLLRIVAAGRDLSCQRPGAADAGETAGGGLGAAVAGHRP